MGSNSIIGIFDLFITAIGAYILYSCFWMKAKNEIRGGMFLPQGIDPNKCLDKDGYIAYIFPRFLLVGIVCLLSGLLGVAIDYFGILSDKAYLALTAVFLVLLIWYGIVSKKAVDKYWGLKK